MQSVNWTGLFVFDIDIVKFWNHIPYRKYHKPLWDFFSYEKLLFVTMLPFGLFYAFVFFLQLFIAAIPQRHWCWVPELAHINKSLRHQLTAPRLAADKTKWDKCNTYDVNWTEVLQSGQRLTPPDPRTPTVPCPNGWEFELTDIPYHTVVSERGWVCQHTKNVPSSQVLFLSGTFLGGFIFGWMADRHGRLPALVGSNMVGCIGGIATIFTHSFWDYAFCRFLVGMSYDHLFMMMYILEYVGPGKRSYFANISTAVFYGAGCVSLPFLALWMADWRKLLWLTSLPMLIVLIVPFILTESASWLLAKGQVTKTAVAVAKVDKPLKKLSENQMAEKTEPPPPPEIHENLRDALKSPPLRNTFVVLIFLFIASAIITCYIAVFGGLVRMSENLGLDFFTTFSLTSITEIPSGVFVALLMDRIGRRALTVGTLMISSTFIIGTMFLPNGIYATVAALGARLFVKMTYLTIILWVTELLPTKVRALGSSIMHMLGSIAIAYAPYVSPAKGVWLLVPLLVLALVTVIAVSLVMLLPDTSKVTLPQTYAETERNVIEYTLVGYYKPDKPVKPVAVPEPKQEQKPIPKKNNLWRKKAVIPIKSIIVEPEPQVTVKPEAPQKAEIADETVKPIEPAIKKQSKQVSNLKLGKIEFIFKPKAKVEEEVPQPKPEEEKPIEKVEEKPEEKLVEKKEDSDVPPLKNLHDTPAMFNLFRPL